jgi:hypothetical protein
MFVIMSGGAVKNEVLGKERRQNAAPAPRKGSRQVGVKRQPQKQLKKLGSLSHLPPAQWERVE